MSTRITAAVVFVLVLAWQQLAQTGGSYDLSHNVIATGGGSNSTGGQYRIDGTAGQPLAGVQSSASIVSIRGGFWAFHQLAPTAASVSISGRIRDVEGRGVTGSELKLTNLSTGEVRTALSSTFGFYRFDEIPVGETYSLTVTSKRYLFDPDVRIISLADELTDIDFTASCCP